MSCIRCQKASSRYCQLYLYRVCPSSTQTPWTYTLSVLSSSSPPIVCMPTIPKPYTRRTRRLKIKTPVRLAQTMRQHPTLAPAKKTPEPSLLRPHILQILQRLIDHPPHLILDSTLFLLRHPIHLLGFIQLSLQVLAIELKGVKDDLVCANHDAAEVRR